MRVRRLAKLTAVVAATLVLTTAASTAVEQLPGAKEHKPYKTVRVGQIPYYVNKTIRREKGYVAIVKSGELSKSNPVLLRDGGARAIEVTTGCPLNRETLTVTVFRSQTFGVYASRIDADVLC